MEGDDANDVDDDDDSDDVDDNDDDSDDDDSDDDDSDDDDSDDGDDDDGDGEEEEATAEKATAKKATAYDDFSVSLPENTTSSKKRGRPPKLKPTEPDLPAEIPKTMVKLSTYFVYMPQEVYPCLLSFKVSSYQI